MPTSSAFDAKAYDDFAAFGYNRIAAELSETPRFFRGENAYVTPGGKLQKRLGSVEIPNSTIPNFRIERLWVYETMETPTKCFYVCSAKNMNTGMYAMFQKRMDSPSTNWTSLGSLRDINVSTRPHEACPARGKLYIKGYPQSTSTEKLGMVVFDGSDLTVRFWGLLGPTEPARLAIVTTRLASSLSATAPAALIFSSVGFPAAPFYAQIEYEIVEVTAIAGVNITAMTRGALGTTPVAHPLGALVTWKNNWTDSFHRVDVNLGWKYSYAYKTATGQISNRAPVEVNIDLPPSTTGPFNDLCPKMTLVGQADTINIPEIVVYRTTDGGGRFYVLDTIANPGAGTFTYEDRHYKTGAFSTIEQDPLPDDQLNTASIATTLNSNSPLPTVLAPLVTGVDTPAASSPIVYYQGRLWIMIGNVLFYTAAEELNVGIPEESCPTGQSGNFFRYQYQGLGLQPTSDALYVFLSSETSAITGNNRESFNAQPILENIGMAAGNPRAITRFGNTVAFLTFDYRVGLINSGNFISASDPLFTDLIDAGSMSGVEFDIKYWADLEKEYVFVAAHSLDNTVNSKWWVYDIKRSKVQQTDFWFVPWSVRSSAICSGRISETSSRRRLIVAMFNNTTNTSGLSRLDPTGRTGTDWFINGTLQTPFNVETHLMSIPPGNHVNALREPAMVPSTYAIVYDRTLYAGDTDPQIYWYLDDFWTDPIEGTYDEDPPRRPLSKAYKTLWCFTGGDVANKVGVKWFKPASDELVEFQRFGVIWLPESGA